VLDTLIVISGTSAGAGSTQSEAFVIDMRQLPSGSSLQLDHIEFASIIGSATVTGGAGDNYVVGDDSAQFISLGEGDDTLFGGAGDDTIGSAAGDDLLFGDAGADTVLGGTGNDTLSGGVGDDMLAGGAGDDVLAGGDGRDAGSFGSAYSVAASAVERSGGSVALEGSDTVESVEILAFSDGRSVVTRDTVSATTTFDETRYLTANPDVATAVAEDVFASGLAHFTAVGNTEDRTGAGGYSFDETFYLATNSDVAAAVGNGQFASGLAHFTALGLAEGRDPNAMFDSAYYLAQNADVSAGIFDGAFTSA
jgi:hypothetical protein